MTRTVTVTTARQAVVCPIWIGRGLISKLHTLCDLGEFSRIALVVDAGAAGTGETLRASLSIPSSATLTLEGGEPCKSVQHLERVWSFFVNCKLDRKSLVIAIGGGALSDLVGFASATYMRGVACLLVPTTLLAQVDAGIGGKTGCNFAGVKNLIGITQQPRAIVVDIDTLSRLSERELRSGFAEVVKHGLIADADYYSRVTSKQCKAWSADELADIIARSCEIKALIVQGDETEQGARKTLNFGHTIGHAIEASCLSSGTPLTHGEAVAIGMCAESFISQRMGILENGQLLSIVTGLTAVGLPTRLPHLIDPASIVSYMSLDKKNVGGKNRWTLLDSIGHAIIDREVPSSIIDEAIAEIQPLTP
jgi:3-dehydroquinate synthase